MSNALRAPARTRRRTWPALIALLPCVAVFLGCGASPEAPPPPASGSATQAIAGVPGGTAAAQATVDLSALAATTSSAVAQRREAPRPFVANANAGLDLRVLPSQPTSSGGVGQVSEGLAAAAALASPSPSASFAALPDDGTVYPPDTMGTVGPNHVMTLLNSGMRIHNRSGGTLSTVSLATFWSRVNTAGLGLFDPTCQYDPYGQRWIVTTDGGENSAQAAIFVGVSQTNDPTGAWNLYRFQADPSGQGWADNPRMGFNKTWVLVDFVRFPLVGSNTTRVMYVIDKQKLYAGAAATFTQIVVNDNLPPPGPAITYDATVGPLYLARSDQAGSVNVYKIDGAVGAETFSQIATVAAPTFSACCVGQGAQLGSATAIGLGPYDLQHIVYRNGSLWMTFSVPGGSSPARTSLSWWQLTPTGTLQQFGLLDDPSGNFEYNYSSLAVNKNNDMLIGFSKFGSSQYPSANYAFRAGTDPVNTLRSEAVLKAGEAPFNLGGSPPCCARWGDYSNTVVDPTNDADLWTIQEFGAQNPSPGSSWGTWWGRVTPPATGTFINAGGPALSPFVADTDFSGGSTINHANTIDLSGVTNPAPMAAYQTARIGNFSYTIPGFVSGSSHTLRLHFAETYFSTAGSRVFNVSINGTQVLSNFDVFKAAGAKNKAVAQQFTKAANSAGQYVLTFTSVVDNSLVSALAIQ